jgi:signal transduction histidine kinase
VAIHLAQQRATAALLQTRDLRAYGERFAFVAHDIKNVSSQLQLLLSNAEIHLADPAFQRDMLATVRASVNRIGGLIRRLEPAREKPEGAALLRPAPLLKTLVAARRQAGWGRLELVGDAAGANPDDIAITMDQAAFQATVTHLLDNAAAATAAGGTVRVSLRQTAGRVVLDIADDGPGMTAEFIRDELFVPFATRTEGGSGLGAFQARELLRAAGGDITVLSQPGHGTTMRLSWPAAFTAAATTALAQPLARTGS